MSEKQEKRIRGMCFWSVMVEKQARNEGLILLILPS